MPPFDYTQNWNNYQRTSQNPYRVREALSMDQDYWTKKYGDTSYLKDLDHGEKNRLLAQGLAEAGHFEDTPEMRAKAFEELQRTGGNFYYRQGQKRTFDPNDEFVSYNANDPASRQAALDASAAGHAETEGGGGGNQSPTSAWTTLPTGNPGAGGAGGTGGTGTFMDLLMGRINQGPVTRDDPNIRNRTAAFSAGQERAKRNYLGDLAEREGPLANLRGEERMAAERQGQAVGGFEAELMGRESDARRQEIMQALTLYGGQLSNEQRIALERELGYLNNSARTADRGQNMDQFLRELALREWMAGDDSDWRWQTQV